MSPGLLHLCKGFQEGLLTEGFITGAQNRFERIHSSADPAGGGGVL